MVVRSTATDYRSSQQYLDTAVCSGACVAFRNVTTENSMTRLWCFHPGIKQKFKTVFRQIQIVICVKNGIRFCEGASRKPRIEAEIS